MQLFVPIAGTWGFRERWWQDDSPLMAFLAPHGLRPLRVAGREFRWSTDLIVWGGRHSDWRAGADALCYYLDDIPLEHRNLVCHSHGGQLAFYAAAAGLEIRRLLTIGTPNRGDMTHVVTAARPHIGRWRHVSDLKCDPWARAGMLFDRRWGGERTFSQADDNVRLPKIRHAGLLHEPKLFPLWQEFGLVDFFYDYTYAEAGHA